MSSLTQDVWTVSELDFPSSGPIQMQLRFLLRYAILAPSVKNTQPWRFAIEENRVRIFADPDRVLHVTDPNRRELYISLGCALENLLVAAEHFGFRHEVFYFPEGEAPAGGERDTHARSAARRSRALGSARRRSPRHDKDDGVPATKDADAVRRSGSGPAGSSPASF